MGAPVPADWLAAARRRPAMPTLLAHVAARILRDPEETAAAEPTLNEELFLRPRRTRELGRRVSYFFAAAGDALAGRRGVDFRPGAAARVVLFAASVATVVALPGTTVPRGPRDEGPPDFAHLPIAHRGPAEGGVFAPERLGFAGARARPLAALRAPGGPPDPVDPSRFHLQVGEVRLPWLPGAQFYLHWYPGLATLLEDFRPDIIDLWEEPWGLVSAHACWLRRRMLPAAKVVSETEQNVSKRLPPPFEGLRRYVYRHADFVVCRNAEAQEVARAKGFRGPLQVVPNAVDADLFRPLDRVDCRQTLLPGGDRFDFLAGYVGRLVEEKGLLDLVNALEFCPPGLGRNSGRIGSVPRAAGAARARTRPGTAGGLRSGAAVGGTAGSDERPRRARAPLPHHRQLERAVRPGHHRSPGVRGAGRRVRFRGHSRRGRHGRRDLS